LNALVITIHVIACISLVILVLLQSGKEGMGVIFGGGSSSLFGSSGAGGVLAKLTAGAATLFFLTSLTITYFSAQQHTAQQESVILNQMQDQAPETPVIPVPEEDRTSGEEQEQPRPTENAGQAAQEQVDNAPSQGEAAEPASREAAPAAE
jgi:preprotein translocase subunit SecG